MDKCQKIQWFVHENDFFVDKSQEKEKNILI